MSDADRARELEEVLTRVHQRLLAPEGAREAIALIARALGAPASDTLAEADGRSRIPRSMRDHFEASADGVVVLDGAARIVFANEVAARLLGRARDALRGTRLGDLLKDGEDASLTAALETVLSGNNVDAFDLAVERIEKKSTTVSATTSTVLAGEGLAVLSLRDVTPQRTLEAELRHTKHFLENLIDSAIDAIIAADLRGGIILFNKGAEQLFGFEAREVIGSIPVWDLYPEGVPRQVMRMLRSESYGGAGRLEQTRREVLTREGELVPVNMTAAIVYEGDREVASVGIFSDLRERIRMEQRLLQIQEKLELQERQSMVAELAGAAAHELNQPLTSILGYAQLIQRRLEAHDEHGRAVQAIASEAERMAEIVKKIGRITRYQTVDYVGATQILDLDASAASSTGIPIAVDAAGDEPTARISLGDLKQSAEGDAGDQSAASSERAHGNRSVD